LTFGEMARAVREQLGQEHRYRHVLRVARLADRLAARHGEDTAKARTAGMLHDLARLFPGPRLIAECERRGLPIDAFERANPIVLHARLSAELARERFGVTDERVLSAIRTHTVPATPMSRLDEIVYLADGLEAGRAYSARAELEALAFRDLAAAMLGVIRSCVADLQARGVPVAPRTFAALAAYERNAARASELLIPVPERSQA
jgi:predicted HD superfamily hydrolase involved in NAD metabolism